LCRYVPGGDVAQIRRDDQSTLVDLVAKRAAEVLVDQGDGQYIEQENRSRKRRGDFPIDSDASTA
jgi:hypothetical protein